MAPPSSLLVAMKRRSHAIRKERIRKTSRGTKASCTASGSKRRMTVEDSTYHSDNQQSAISLPPNPQSTIPLPPVNPFLQGRTSIQLQYSINRGRAEEGSSAGIKVLVPHRPTRLFTAREAKTFDNTLAIYADEKHARTVVKILYARHHWVDDSTLYQCIIPARLNEIVDGTRTLAKALTTSCDGIQCGIMKFYYTGVSAVVKSMGGVEKWKAMDVQSRMRLFGRLFDEYPLDIATAALGLAAEAVPLREIFSDSTIIHKKWQKFHRKVFTLTCEATFEHRIAPGSDRFRKRTYRTWQTMTSSAIFDAMDLGDLEDLPVNWNTGNARKRRPLCVDLQGVPPVKLADP